MIVREEPSAATEPVGFRIPVDLLQEIDRIAKHEGLERTPLIIGLLRAGLEAKGKGAKIVVVVKRKK
jgi:metal-responsive CopG/Arc/MetJ family transcriptional regulator